MKVWIDLSNSPHPLIFVPIARHLTDDGHDVFITARDHAQPSNWRENAGPSLTLSAPKARKRTAKLAMINKRVEMLRRRAGTGKSDVALSQPPPLPA